MVNSAGVPPASSSASERDPGRVRMGLFAPKPLRSATGLLAPARTFSLPTDGRPPLPCGDGARFGAFFGNVFAIGTLKPLAQDADCKNPELFLLTRDNPEEKKSDPGFFENA